jgi:hypothetical protein
MHVNASGVSRLLLATSLCLPAFVMFQALHLPFFVRDDTIDPQVATSSDVWCASQEGTCSMCVEQSWESLVNYVPLKKENLSFVLVCTRASQPEEQGAGVRCRLDHIVHAHRASNFTALSTFISSAC